MSDNPLFQERPETLMDDAVAACINPASGVTMANLDLEIAVPGQVLIVPDSSTISQPGWIYYGHAVATYQRIDLGVLLGDYEIRMMVSFPATTMDIVNQLNVIFDLVITEDDVVNEILPSLSSDGMAYFVKASPSSTMWVGQRQVNLYPFLLPPSGS
jgi:hypothetical protein